MTKQLPKPGEVFRRTVTVEKDALAKRDPGDERIPVSISSEYPVERLFGREVLVHTREAVDMEHATGGLPFLDSHDSTRQLGVVEDIHIGTDRRLRGMLRKGNHPDAIWMFRDIEDGVRPNLSAGYQILKAVQDETDPDTVRVTRWKPMEVSSVSVPADITVGVGRSGRDSITAPGTADDNHFGCDNLLCTRPVCGHPEQVHAEAEGDAPDAIRTGACQRTGCPCNAFTQENFNSVGKSITPARKAKERNVSDEVKTDGAEPEHKAGPDAVTLKEARDEIRKQVADVVNLAREHGVEQYVKGWLDRGLSKDQVAVEILERKKGEARPTPPGFVDLTVKDASDYRINRAIMNIADKRWETDGGLEKEVSDTVAKQLKRSTSGFLIPMNLKTYDLQTRASVTGNIATTTSLGGAGVQTTVLSLIDLLRNRMLVRQLGATVIGGLQGNVTFPRQITANSLTWTGENPSAGNTLTAATLDNVTLSPKTAMVSTAYSRQLLIQASFDASQFVQSDMALVGALGIDLAAIAGLGSANQPTGVLNTTGVNTVTHTGANGGIPTWADMVAYETQVATNNGDIGSINWLTTPGMRGKLKTVLRSTTAGSQYLWADDQTINGYSAYVSAQVPANLTFGTSTTVAHGVIFGVWSELLIAEWGGAMEIIVDPYTLASQNMVAVTAMFLVDIGVRHPKAFTVGKGALII